MVFENSQPNMKILDHVWKFQTVLENVDYYGNKGWSGAYFRIRFAKGGQVLTLTLDAAKMAKYSILF